MHLKQWGKMSKCSRNSARKSAAERQYKFAKRQGRTGKRAHKKKKKARMKTDMPKIER